MNFFQKFINNETRMKIYNYLRLSSYHSHPELKIKGIPTKRWKMLMTMRDLRLWIEENAPYSSRYEQYKSEIYQINHELNYLQLRRLVLSLAFFVGFSIYFMYWSPRHLKGAISIQSRPVLLGETGGYSVLHDGTVPKFTTIDLTAILGI